MSYVREPKDLLKSRSVIVKAPVFQDVIPPHVEEELTCFVTRVVLQAPPTRIRWVSAKEGMEKEVVNMLQDACIVDHGIFHLDHPSNISNVDESIWNALVRDECIAVTCSLKSLNKLLTLVGDDNAYRQYCHDNFGSDPGRYINLMHPSFCFPKFDLIILDPSKFPPSGLTIYSERRGDKKYIIAEDGCLREFPGTVSCPRPRPFMAPGNRPIIYSINPFLVVLNAWCKISKYERRNEQPGLPPDVQKLYDKTKQLGEAIFWKVSRRPLDDGVEEPYYSPIVSQALASTGTGDGDDDDDDEDDEVVYELRDLNEKLPQAPKKWVEARKAYGEALMGGPLDHDVTEEDISLLKELNLPH